MRFFFLCSVIFFNNFGYEHIQPMWNDQFDFKSVEEHMEKESIRKLTPMREFLDSRGKTAAYTNDVYLAELTSGFLSVYKPGRLEDSIAEVSAYSASQALGWKLVPPTIIKTTSIGTVGSLQGYVESPFDLLKPEDHEKAFALIPEERKAAMNLFYWVFGQWDTNRGNQIISYDVKTGRAHLALIDNTAIGNRVRARYGDHFFVRRAYQEGTKPYTGEPFPYEKPVIIEIPTTTNQAAKILGGFNIPQDILDRWHSYGMEQQACVVHDDFLWVQFYRNNKWIKPNYTSVYPKNLMQDLETLNKDSLKIIYKQGIEYKAKFCNDAYFNDILSRRDVVLEASVQQNALNTEN